MKKVLAFNGSPNKEHGITNTILTSFLKGMRDAGADVELLYTQDLDIKPCRSDIACWIKTPGTCFQKDDMNMVLSKFLEADVIVLASPLYCYCVTATMKTMIDRMIPIAEPMLGLAGDSCRHSRRLYVKKNQQLVLVSTCGFYTTDGFDPLTSMIKKVSIDFGLEYKGALLRPHGFMIPYMKHNGIKTDIFEIAESLGSQLIINETMSEEDLSKIGKDLATCEEYVKLFNNNLRFVMGKTKYNQDLLKEPNAVEELKL